MKILITHGYFIAEDVKEQAIMKPYVPLGILYISAFLEQHGFENEVFDSTFSSFEILKQRLITDRPDVLAIYVNLMTKVNVIKVMKIVKSTPELANTKIILGGPEVKNHAENFLLYGADYIVTGEGEETMLELCKHIEQNKSEEELKNISALIFKNSNGEVIKNPARALLKNIDLLPFPNRKKIDLNAYLEVWKERHQFSTISVNTMRGCPYTCKWCSRAVYGQSYRRRSAKLVVAEIKSLQENYQFDKIWFVDDVFTVSHKWLKEFHDEVINEKLIFSYEIITRADRLDEETIKLLKASGCFRIWIGAESGSQKIIDAMDRRVDVVQVREMIKLTSSYGMEAGTFIMLGYPGETIEDINETIHHLKTSDPDYYTITIAYPIKGTELYEEIEKDITTKLEWSESTDRDIDFKRTYSKKYYEYAVRLVYNEVRIEKIRKHKKESILKIPYLKAKSIASRIVMEFSK